jgi:uncharacterized integral membrane protein
MAYEPGRSDPVGSGGGPLGGGEVEGRDRRQVTRLVVAGVLVLVGLIFVLQNSERVETTFLVFNVTTRLWVGLLCALVLGAILGQIVEAAWQRRRRG